jgi:CRISPR associated protein
MAPEPPQLPPLELAPRVRLVRLPLRVPVVDAIHRRLVRSLSGTGRLELAHELGDVRFAQTFAPERRRGETTPRWNGGLAVFGLLDGPPPTLLAYTLRSLTELAEVPLPNDWRSDPYDWSAAEETVLLPRLERRIGRAIPFAAEIWPKVRIIDPTKAPSGKRRIPRTREIDAAKVEQARRAELSRPEAYGLWLQRQMPMANIDPATVRIVGETTASTGNGRNFAILGVRLSGILSFSDPVTIAVALLRGVGRRRAYGLGVLVLA